MSEERRSLLLDLYKIAVDEYRFQVNLNWDRSKYLLGFNTAVVGVGTGLVKIGSELAAPLLVGVFAVGALSAGLSAIAVNLQHTYYRSTRDRMVAIAQELGVEPWGVATTPGARRERSSFISRMGRVQNILYTLLAVVAAVDAMGIVYVVAQ